jgi:high-affinity nickel permease
VTSGRADPTSMNALRSIGHSSVFLNPFVAFYAVAVLENSIPINNSMSSVVTRWSCFYLHFSAVVETVSVLRGLKNAT